MPFDLVQELRACVDWVVFEVHARCRRQRTRSQRERFMIWVCLLGNCTAASSDDGSSSDGDSGPTIMPLTTVFDPSVVAREFEEVVPCRFSHEHALRHVRIFADPVAAEVYRRCVLSGLGDSCPDGAFPVGSLFVKYEYDRSCASDQLVGYTASLRLENGSYPTGFDWWWQSATTDLQVVEEGAPASCLNCHVDHCQSPMGFELRCLPD